MKQEDGRGLGISPKARVRREAAMRALRPSLRGTSNIVPLRHRKAQVEMIGLLFVVILIVVGLLLYVKLGGRGPDVGASARESQYATSFLLAVKETTIPECRATVERVARACIEDEHICGRDPCDVLQDSLAVIGAGTLTREGAMYNLSLEKTGVMVEVDCPYDAVSRSASPRVPIILSGGQTYGYLRLNVCR